jgi:hypothetical protein
MVQMSGILEPLSKIIASLALPIVLAVLGYWFNDSLKSRELNVKYVEIAVNVLSQPPSEETKSLRLWAIDLINMHAAVKIDDALREVLVNEEALPVSALSNPQQGYREFVGRRQVDKIIISDTQNGNTESELRALAARGVSYHYLIGPDGKIHSLVDENNVAFHAAKFNGSSIGIGLTHLSGSAYPPEQIDALKKLIVEIAQRWNLKGANIFGKEELDPRKKTDFATVKADILRAVDG